MATRFVAASLMASVLVAQPALAQTIRVMPVGEMPAGLRVGVVTGNEDALPDWLERAEDGTWTYVVARKPGEWRAEFSLAFDVPERLLETGVTVASMELSLDFSIKATLADEAFEVPLALLPSTWRTMRQKLDLMDQQRRRILEQILLAQALTRHYLVAPDLGPGTDHTRFAAQKWFDAVYRAIVEERRSLRLTSSLTAAVQLVFEGRDYFHLMSNELRSLFWLDAAELDDLLDDDQCGWAEALVDDLRRRDADFPDGATLRSIEGGAAAYLTRLDDTVALECGEGEEG